MEFTSFRSFVVDDGNGCAYEAVHDAANNPDGAPVSLLIQGPHGSGKSHLLHAAALDCKLLWGNRILYVPAAEVQLALTLMDDGRSDDFFAQIGSCGLLLLDDADELLQDEVAAELLTLLLAERKRLGLGTVLSATAPVSLTGLRDSWSYADNFTTIAIGAMEDTPDTRFARGKNLLALYDERAVPAVRDDALRVVMSDYVTSGDDVWTAIRFLAEGTGIGGGRQIGVQEVEELFA